MLNIKKKQNRNTNSDIKWTDVKDFFLIINKETGKMLHPVQKRI